MSNPVHLTLIDGSGYIFRAYHSLPPMTRPDGTPVGAVYGFTSMLIKLLTGSKATHLAVVFDAGRRTFRNDIYPGYKAQRPELPEDLIPQFAVIRDAVRAFNLPCIERNGFEADDLIATFAKRARAEGAEVTIVSSDKDLMQLVGDGISMLDPMKNRAIGPAEVMEKFGVGPDRVVDVQALAGDPIDNVPGVPGIGIKTAALLINEFGNLDALLERAGEIPQKKRRENLIEYSDAARISRDLVRLKDDVDVGETVPDFALACPDPAILRAFLDENGFRSLIPRAEALAGKAPPGPSVPSGQNPDEAPSGGRVSSDAALKSVRDARDDYHLVTTMEELDLWLQEAARTGVLAIDTETDSLDCRRATLVGISLATAPGRACYIPFAHKNADAASPQMDLLGAPEETAGPDDVQNIEDPRGALHRIGQMLADTSILKIGHNIKFDLHVLTNAGLPVASPIEDTMVLSYVIDGMSHRHGMDELADLHLGRRTISFQEVCFKGKASITFDKVPLDKALTYAAEDADVTLRLYLVLRDLLLKNRLVRVYETIDRPMISVLAAMEEDGITVDAKRLKVLSGEFAKAMGDLEREIHGLAGAEFNIGSPKQLGEILFGEQNLEGGKRSSKTGAWSTDAKVLDQLAGEGHELPAKVLEWRGYQKLKSTYTDALVADIDPRTGRIHTTYSLTVTSTGRLSSTDPNLQNIPIRTEEGRKIRDAFIAAPGMRLVSADYSQIELRLVAHVAGIKALREAFANGQDIHAITASQVFGIPLEGMDPMIRRQAKAINFGIIYGISAHGLARQLGITRTEAGAFIEAYMARFPEITTYMEATKTQARTQGFVTTPLGRRIPIPGITDRNQAIRAFAERQAINAPIQGGAADIIKRAMIRLPDAFQEASLTGRMLLQVHDELVFEVPDPEVDRTIPVIKRIMEGAVGLVDETGATTVPLDVDVGVGETWARAH